MVTALKYERQIFQTAMSVVERSRLNHNKCMLYSLTKKPVHDYVR